MPATFAEHIRSTTRTWQTGFLCLLLVACLAGAGVAESIALVLLEGDSTILRFNRMQRVATVDPAVADVVVTSLSELLVIGKGPGRTMVHIWDRAGRHDYAVVVKPSERAQETMRHLREILPPEFTFQILDNRTLLVRGEVASQRQQDQIQKIMVDMAEDKSIHLVTVYFRTDLALSPAQRQAMVLREVLGPRFQYVVWDDNTVMIMGEVASKPELDQVEQFVKATGTAVSVANLVSVGPAGGPPPTQEIAQALGEGFRVWPLHGRTVVVEGIVPDESLKERADQILSAFAPRASVVNLVAVAEAPGLTLEERQDLLQTAVGQHLRVRIVGGKALAVEGSVPSEADLEAVGKVIALFSKETEVLNLVRHVDPTRERILVKARVLDIRTKDLDRLGLTWGEIRGGDLSSRTHSWLMVAHSRPILDFLYQPGTLVDALGEETKARVLAEPDLLVNEGEEAEILVGGEIPIPVPQSGAAGVTITIEYKPFGVSLKMKPQLIEGNRIRLHVTPEVSDIDTSIGVTIAGFNVPGFRTRRTETTVDVESGQTLAIGGLFSRDRSQVMRKVPLVGDLPIIGDLFRTREFVEGESEMVVLITPFILGAEGTEDVSAGPPSLTLEE